MEASTIPAPAATLPRPRALSAPAPLLRLRSDEQLVRLFRAGNEEAFRAIHDRYRARLFAYTRQMMSGSRADAEDVLQDVFVRAYGALRAGNREIALRAWLYRVAHNRCIDHIRRPVPPPETFASLSPPAIDPIAISEQRESLRRLVADVRRLPEQQRSALLMREIGGMSYEDLAGALDVTVPAIKSLLVRARVGLAASAEARDTTCFEIREQLAGAHERGVRATGLARRHMQECDDCRAYRSELRSTHARFAALTPTLGPIAVLAKLLGIGGGVGAGGAAAAGGGSAAAGGSASGAVAGVALGGGTLGVTASHVVAVVAAVVVSAGGAVEVQHTFAPSHHHHHAHHAATGAHAPSAVAVASIGSLHAGANAAHATKPHRVVKLRHVPAPPAPIEDPQTSAVSGGAGLPADLASDDTATDGTTSTGSTAPAGETPSATPPSGSGSGETADDSDDTTSPSDPTGSTASTATDDGASSSATPAGGGPASPPNTAAAH